MPKQQKPETLTRLLNNNDSEGGNMVGGSFSFEINSLCNLKNVLVGERTLWIKVVAPLTLHPSHQLTHVSCETILGGRTRQTHSSEIVFNQLVNDHLSDNLTRSDPWDFSQSQWVCECWEECGVDISAWEDSDWWWWSGLASYHPQLHQNLLQTDQHHQCHQLQLLVEEICPSQSEN